MIRVIKILILTIVINLVSIHKLEAQSDLNLYGLRVIPQSNFSNPAFIPTGNLYIGIPLISSISNSTYSSSFSFDDIFVSKENSDSLFLNLNKLASNTAENNFITEYFENDLIYFGIKLNNNFLNIGVRNRLYSRAIYTTDFVKLLWNGNGNYIDEQLNLSNTIINHDHFLSYYIGFGFMIGDNVSLGIRGSLNQGLSSIETSRNNIIIETVSNDDDVFNLIANTGFTINTSGVSSDSTGDFNTVTDYVFNFQNIGFSFDIGGDFKLSERVSLNFSVLDLGFINWKSNLQSYESTSDSIEFSGINADFNSTEDIFKAYGDSLAELIDINRYEQNYRSTLPTRFFIGFEYYGYDRSNRLSVVFSGTFLKNNFLPAISVAYDKTVSKHFTFKVNYSYLEYSPLNVGVGLVFNFNPFQFYILTDNIMSAFSWSGQQYINFRLGINLAITGRQKFKKGEPVFFR